MRSPYTPHFFGDVVERKLKSRTGWLTAGVATSIPWPPDDVCVTYDGDDYFMRGAKQKGMPSTPCITIAYGGDADATIAKIYRFTSILGWFLGGYVDVVGYIRGSHPVVYGGPALNPTIGEAGPRRFTCNYLPEIRDENTRKALAFWREGSRLDRVHSGYAFLSYYKVIESQFRNSKRETSKSWMKAHLARLDGPAGDRVARLTADGVDVFKQLYASGRCAIAHASLDDVIVDPDIAADRRRIATDLVMMRELARLYIQDELGVPDAISTYRSRDRLRPWHALLDLADVELLKEAKPPLNLARLEGRTVSVGLWPEGPIAGLERMRLHVDAVDAGAVRIVLDGEKKTLELVFVLDFRNGRAHTQLEVGGLAAMGAELDEEDVRAYATFFYTVFSHGIAQLWIDGLDPIECEVVIPVNMMLSKTPAEAIAATLEDYRRTSRPETPLA